MAQDNRQFLKLCAHVNNLIDKHAVRDLYAFILKDGAEISEFMEYSPNHYIVKLRKWLPPNINNDIFPTDYKIRLKPNDD